MRIDLGTSRSAAAVMVDGEARPVSSSESTMEGAKSFPSAAPCSRMVAAALDRQP